MADLERACEAENTLEPSPKGQSLARATTSSSVDQGMMHMTCAMRACVLHVCSHVLVFVYDGVCVYACTCKCARICQSCK